MSERQPLLPTVHSHAGSRLSSPRISFPGGGAASKAQGTDLALGPDLTATPAPGFTTSTRGFIPGAPGGLGQGVIDRNEGIPALTWEYLWSEAKCYGSYILPTFFVFGVCGIGLALLIVGLARGWFNGSG